MAPNDVELVRVWTKVTGSSVADLTFPSGTRFEVVVDCEAGKTIGTSGSPWEIHICVRDLYDNNPVVHTAIQKGNLGTAPWNNLDFGAIFVIPAPNVTREGHTWEVIASLKVRPIDPDISFDKSPLFCITTP